MEGSEELGQAEGPLAFITSPEALLHWWEQFDLAWDWLEELSIVDGPYSRQYQRIAGQAIVDAVPGCQAALRTYILGQACAALAEGITEASLRARQERLNQKKGQTDEQ